MSQSQNRIVQNPDDFCCPERLALEVLELERDLEPGIDVTAVLGKMHAIVERVGERIGESSTLGDILFTLNDCLFNELAFACEPQADLNPRLTLLHRVVQQRRGEPLALAILYLTVGRSLGLSLHACLFPGRILVAYRDEVGELLLDPASGGIQLQDEDLQQLLTQRYGLSRLGGDEARRFLSDLEDRTIIIQLLHHLKQSFLRLGDVQHALWALEKLLQLAPQMPSGFRDRGRLYEQLDCGRAAAEDYCRYLELVPDASDAEILRRRLPLLLGTHVTLH